MSADPNQQDLANREFDKVTPGLSDEIKGLRSKGFQQVTLVAGLEFPSMTGYVQTGPSVFNNYGTNTVGSAVPPLVNPGLPGGPGGGTPGPGEGGSGDGNGAGPGEEVRYACVDDQCVPDPDGAFHDLGECQESGCDSDRNEDDVDGNNGQNGGPGSGNTQGSFMAQITGHQSFSPNIYRWKYSWQEVTLPGYGAGDGFTVKVNGRYGTLTQDYALNVRESVNAIPSGATTGFAGPGYKIELDEAFKPIAVGTTISGGTFNVVVLMHRSDNGRYVFESDNTIDGACP